MMHVNEGKDSPFFRKLEIFKPTEVNDEIFQRELVTQAYSEKRNSECSQQKSKL